MSITLKRGDTWPPLVVSVSDDNGAIDLTTASEIRLLLKSSSYTLETDPVSPSDAGSGEITYDWQVGDTDNSGTYQLEVEIVWATGQIQTVPNDGYGEVKIIDDLGGVSPA